MLDEFLGFVEIQLLDAKIITSDFKFNKLKRLSNVYNKYINNAYLQYLILKTSFKTFLLKNITEIRWL